jgi:5-methylcytosine-specific restriction endonuclease McrA
MKNYKGRPIYPVVNGYKICNVCEEDKPVLEFKIKKDSGNLYNECTKCSAERRKAYEQTEEYKKIRKEYKERNKERIREQARTWRAKKRAQGGPKKLVVMSLERRTKCREVSRRRRAKKLGLPWEYYTEAQVLELYGNNCHVCLEPVSFDSERRPGYLNWELGLHIDHLIPISKGGGDTLENVRPAHGICNIKKHNRDKQGVVV